MSEIKYNDEGLVVNIKLCPYCGELRPIGSEKYFCSFEGKVFLEKDLLTVHEFIEKKLKEERRERLYGTMFNEKVEDDKELKRCKPKPCDFIGSIIVQRLDGECKYCDNKWTDINDVAPICKVQDREKCEKCGCKIEVIGMKLCERCWKDAINPKTMGVTEGSKKIEKIVIYDERQVELRIKLNELIEAFNSKV